jgi:polyisoprenoid-binding protein YceI
MSTATIAREILPAAGTWSIDTAHSSVEAVVRHLVVSRVRGRFASFSGTVQIGDDVTDSSLDVSIDAASIDTGVEDRDQHLRSADFLDVDTHPTITFRSTQVQHVDGDRWQVPGELTIRGETRPVTLDVEFLGRQTDPWGNDKAAFEARTTIAREDFGITWNQALETGGVLVGKELTVELLVQLQPAG